MGDQVMSKREKTDYVLKIALLGDTAVGKTSLINRFLDNSFKENYAATMGVNIMTKIVELKDLQRKVRLVLWDIAGQETYRQTQGHYYEGCNGALLIYDITRYSSFDNIKAKWLRDYNRFIKKNRSYILIGNKVDLKDGSGIEKEQAEQLANEINAIDFIETSAKEGKNVDTAFTRIAEFIIKSKEE